jgi:hypothetical protein
MAKKKLRPLGEIQLDLEPLFYEMVHDHGLQKGDLSALVNQWVDTHYPQAIETYFDDTTPIYFYGHIEGLRKILEGKND